MTPRTADHDPFDLGFEAADEFASTSADPWRDEGPLLRQPAGVGSDPFADFPPARSALEDDPFADLSLSPAPAASPVPYPTAHAPTYSAPETQAALDGA